MGDTVTDEWGARGQGVDLAGTVGGFDAVRGPLLARKDEDYNDDHLFKESVNQASERERLG